jgi:ribonuclease BN (tRNA processing enzyme)
VKIRILGAHSTESRGARLAALIVDGVLALDAGSLTSAMTLEEQRSIKAVLLTHHHFDHVRDLVTLGMNLSVWQGQVPVYGLASTLKTVYSCLLDGSVYVNYAEFPSKERPCFRFVEVEPAAEFDVAGYRVWAIPVQHAVEAVGYQVESPQGRRLFYTGDTGPGFVAAAGWVSPHVLITEVSGPNEKEAVLRRSGHLWPSALGDELVEFRGRAGYLPRVVVGHLSAPHESTIAAEVAEVAERVGAEIVLAREDLALEV